MNYYETNESGHTYLVVVRPDGTEIHRRDFETYGEYVRALSE